MSRITAIGFDADDTLWHNERFYRLTQDRFASLLAGYTEPEHLAERLLEAERRNIGHYGFGIKGFMLSMIETAVEVTDGASRPRSSPRSSPPGRRCWPIRLNSSPMPARPSRPWPAGSACC